MADLPFGVRAAEKDKAQDINVSCALFSYSLSIPRIMICGVDFPLNTFMAIVP